MNLLNINGYNVDVATVLGVCQSILLSCVEEERQFQLRHKLIGDNNTVPLSRQEIYERTAMSDEDQKKAEESLGEGSKRCFECYKFRMEKGASYAKKHNLVHFPALYYLNDVKMCRTLKELYGEEEFERLAFTGTYEEMIPSELLEQYKMAERIRYFSRKGYIVDPTQIDISEESRNIK